MHSAQHSKYSHHLNTVKHQLMFNTNVTQYLTVWPKKSKDHFSTAPIFKTRKPIYIIFGK